MNAFFATLWQAAAETAEAATQEEWAPVEAAGTPWWVWAALTASFAGMLFLLYRAVNHRKLYRVEGALPEDKRQAVHRAIREAEETTVGEIVPVVIGRCDRYPAADLWSGIAIGVFAFLLVWAVASAPTPGDLLYATILGGVIGWGVSRFLPEIRRHFVAPWRAVEMADEQALQEFYGLGLHRTEAKTGVMLFVALFERRVVILGDEGIDEKVPQEKWRELHKDLLKAAREERLADRKSVV